MVNPITDIDKVTKVILGKRAFVSKQRSLLVGLSGIDGSGKGFLAKQIVARLWQHSVPTASINVDGWLNLPQKRFNPDNPAEHFYNHAIRFEEMLRDVIVPLRSSRSHVVEANIAEETGTQYQRRTLKFENAAVVIVEGIFLFKQALREYFDLRIWIDCSFSTALARALERKQEGLPSAATIKAYETIYFPAQRIHMGHDNPRDSADLIINNDPYLRRERRYERGMASVAATFSEHYVPGWSDGVDQCKDSAPSSTNWLKRAITDLSQLRKDLSSGGDY
ncbi:MAG TPA: hypothetical protein VFH31_20525 [Pyrinomonadaceae bacterium]|nr:hypothetical protein [Pyrinomonadaceae bacterium]